MAIGERIRRIRNMRGMTLKYLGEAVGFPANNADVQFRRRDFRASALEEIIACKQPADDPLSDHLRAVFYSSCNRQIV